MDTIYVAIYAQANILEKRFDQVLCDDRCENYLHPR